MLLLKIIMLFLIILMKRDLELLKDLINYLIKNSEKEEIFEGP